MNRATPFGSVVTVALEKLPSESDEMVTVASGIGFKLNVTLAITAVAFSDMVSSGSTLTCRFSSFGMIGMVVWP